MEVWRRTNQSQVARGSFQGGFGDLFLTVGQPDGCTTPNVHSIPSLTPPRLFSTVDTQDATPERESIAGESLRLGDPARRDLTVTTRKLKLMSAEQVMCTRHTVEWFSHFI